MFPRRLEFTVGVKSPQLDRTKIEEGCGLLHSLKLEISGMFEPRVYLCLCSVDLPWAGVVHAMDVILGQSTQPWLFLYFGQEESYCFFLSQGIRPIMYVGRSIRNRNHTASFMRLVTTRKHLPQSKDSLRNSLHSLILYFLAVSPVFIVSTTISYTLQTHHYTDNAARNFTLINYNVILY